MALRAKPDPMSGKSKQTASGEARLIEGMGEGAREKCGCLGLSRRWRMPEINPVNWF